VAESDWNVFWQAGGAGYVSECVDQQRAMALDEWRRMGHDAHSVIADPLFVDPGRDDYRLRPESPALRLGFQPVDMVMALAGIRAEAD
jgi:hypothetical protein